MKGPSHHRCVEFERSRNNHHKQTTKPTNHELWSFNTETFSTPFLCTRAKLYSINIFLKNGFAKSSEDDFKSLTVHSYLLFLVGELG